MTTVAFYNESFFKVIIDIPGIATNNLIDRYTRGLKPHISKELCTSTYNDLTTPMSHALSVTSSKLSFSRSLYGKISRSDPVPMDISNTSLVINKESSNLPLRTEYNRVEEAP